MERIKRYYPAAAQHFLALQCNKCVLSDSSEGAGCGVRLSRQLRHCPGRTNRHSKTRAVGLGQRDSRGFKNSQSREKSRFGWQARCAYSAGAQMARTSGGGREACVTNLLISKLNFLQIETLERTFNPLRHGIAASKNMRLLCRLHRNPQALRAINYSLFPFSEVAVKLTLQSCDQLAINDRLCAKRGDVIFGCSPASGEGMRDISLPAICGSCDVFLVH